MSLAYVILGLLQQQERTGYDLKTECFDQCIAHLWQADQAQIYRTLEKLEAQGWICCTIQVQHDRPNRKIYHLSESGKAEFTQWLQTHQLLPVVREPLLVQLYFAAQLPNAVIIQLLEQQREARQRKLTDCETLQRSFVTVSPAIPDLQAPTACRDQVLQRLALDLVTRREQTYLDWLNQAIATLQNQPE